MVFVVLGVVEFVVCRLGDAPRHLFGTVVLEFRVADKGFLCSYGETVGLVHEGVLVCGEEDEWHKILEECSVPRGDTFVSFVLYQGLVETEPVLVGYVALRDG